MKFRKDVMENSAKHGFTNATDAADYLVNHGVPFRDAHGIVGRLVLYCLDKKISAGRDELWKNTKPSVRCLKRIFTKPSA